LNLDTPRGSRYQKVPTNTHTKLSYLQYIFETLIICIPQKKETKTPSLHILATKFVFQDSSEEEFQEELEEVRFPWLRAVTGRHFDMASSIM